MGRANELVQKHASARDQVVYVDMVSTLLGNVGQSKDVFVEDGLHLNEWGYELWAEALLPYLD
ncbi:MAG: hypothetical protein HOM16_08465 [Woeseia sp.]|jgi:lysophospholipase L1-like esterase|nr:hypothetical protein [Woeseia sp.]